MYNTGNAVPSSALEDMADNAQTFDALVTKTEGTTTDRLGRTRRVFQQILMDIGFQPLAGSFQTGATITARNQTLYDEVSQVFYAWGGTIPVGGYVVAAGSTPATSGGVGVGVWSDKTDLMLRSELLSGPISIRNNKFSLSDFVSVSDYVVVGDGVIDDYAALTLALNSGNKAIFIPPWMNIYSSQGVVIPAGVMLWSVGFIPSSSGVASGARITVANSVAVALTLQGNAGLEAAGAKGFTVSRTGIPPAGSLGVLVSNGYNPILEDVLSINHAIPIKFDGSAGGISCSPLRVFTAGATDAHVLIYNWPELRSSQCRFGSNGNVDVPCNAYVRVSGSGAGPNTVMFDNCQFNQGQSAANTVGTLWDFANLTGGNQGGLVGQFSMANCHTEGHAVAVKTDSTVTILDRLTFSNVGFTDNVATGEFWALNAATQLNYFKMVECDLTTHLFTLSPASQINNMTGSNNTFGGLVTITGTGNSTVDLAHCDYTAGLTIAGSFFSAFFGGEITGGALTTTGITSGRVQLNFPSTYDWIVGPVPVLSFGGLSTGITYTTQKSQYRIIGDLCIYEFVVTLSSKGSATGTAKIAGLPFNATNSFGPQGGSAAPYITGMVSLGGAVTVSPESGTKNMNIYQTGATGIGALTDANFTNTTTITGTLMYAM